MVNDVKKIIRNNQISLKIKYFVQNITLVGVYVTKYKVSSRLFTVGSNVLTVLR